MFFKKKLDIDYGVNRIPEKLPLEGSMRLGLMQDWDDRLVDIVRKKKIESFSINSLSTTHSLDFLESLKDYNLREVALYVYSGKDIRGLIHLKDSLEVFVTDIISFTKAPDFTQFPKLRLFDSNWRNSLKSVLESQTITSLGLGKHPFETLEPFANMPQIETLVLHYGKLKSLKGIENLPNLKELSIFSARKLESLDGIQNAPKLEKAVITRCKQITPDTPFAEYVTFNDLY